MPSISFDSSADEDLFPKGLAYFWLFLREISIQAPIRYQV